MTVINYPFNQQARSLAIRSFMDHKIHIVENTKASLALLEKAYNGVYLDAFPLEEERDSLEQWHNLLRGKSPHTELIIVILGNGLDGPQPTIKALSVAEYYPAKDVGLMRYNAVAPEYRNESLGRIMVDIRKEELVRAAYRRGRPLGGIFVQCNDPAKIKPEDDSMDPALRIRIFEKYGARVEPFDCLLPPLLPGYPPCDFLKLLSYPHPVTGKYPSMDAIKDYMHAIFVNLSPAHDPQDSLNYHRNLARISMLGSAQVPSTSRRPQIIKMDAA